MESEVLQLTPQQISRHMAYIQAEIKAKRKAEQKAKAQQAARRRGK